MSKIMDVLFERFEKGSIFERIPNIERITEIVHFGCNQFYIIHFNKKSP